MRIRVDFERKSSVWVSLRFLDDKVTEVIRRFFFFAASVLLFLVGEASQQQNLFSNCENHFRKRST